MKIIRVDIHKFDIPFKHAVVVPIGILKAANNVLIVITTDSGLKGYGEASPFSPISGDTQESNYENARHFAVSIMGKDPCAVEARMSEFNCRSKAQPSLRSAFDMALYDILGKAAKLPLYRLLGGEKRALRTDFTIGLQESVAKTLDLLREGLDQGFNEVKLKVGRPGLADIEHVAAVRQFAGPDLAIKIDSNQGWDFPTAVANLQAMEPFGILYSEQPLVHWDHENLRQLRSLVKIPICADESVFDDQDALKLVNMGAVDYLNIKLGKAGGITTALRIEAIARAANHKCMIGCFAESRLGLTAAAHLACARPNIAFLDLDSALSLSSDPVIGGITYDQVTGGKISLPEAPGLGASISEQFPGLRAHYSITE